MSGRKTQMEHMRNMVKPVAMLILANLADSAEKTAKKAVGSRRCYVTGNLSIRFWHPTKDLSFLSSLLGLSCVRSWVAGTQRQTPRGNLLPGLYRESYWYSDLVFNVEERFNGQFSHAIDILVKANETIREIKDSGGVIELYLQLPGSVNIGDTIDSTLLCRLGEMGVNLSVEVFPDMMKPAETAG